MNNKPERTEMIRGLRELADYLESTEELPIPRSIEITYHAFGEDDAAERSEIDRIGAILGSNPNEEVHGAHYVVSRSFGEHIEYRAVAINQQEMERYRAGSTYIDVVTPEEWPI